MKKLTEEEIKNLTFPDADVLEFKLNLKEKTLYFNTDLAHTTKPNDKLLGKTTVKITDWEKIKIQEWDGENYQNIDPTDSKTALRNICENTFNDRVILKGFTVGTGHWTEYSFSGGQVVIESTFS